MRYLIKRLWPLIVLLLVSAGVVLRGPTDVWYYRPLRQFFLFATYVIIVGTVFGQVGRRIPRRFRV